MLDALGMDGQAEAVYRLILDQPEWGVAEIAAHLGRPEDAIHRVLDTLVGLGLITAGPGESRPRPVHPQIGLAGLLARSEAELGARQRQIEAVRAAVDQLAVTYHARRGFAPDTIERHESLEAVRTRLAELARTARAECLSLLTGGAQLPDTMAASKPLDQLALERGVVIRSIYQDSYRNDAATAAYVRWLAALGARTRTTPVLPMLLVVIDREVALVPIDPHDGRRGALELRSPGVVAAMCALFEQIWANARAWDTGPVRDEHGLSDGERELLRLLADGVTDEVAARRLGISLRTVRRMTANLMSRLEAHSRFQAGAHAAHRHWI